MYSVRIPVVQAIGNSKINPAYSRGIQIEFSNGMLIVKNVFRIVTISQITLISAILDSL